jgi:hypothetical protein
VLGTTRRPRVGVVVAGSAHVCDLVVEMCDIWRNVDDDNGPTIPTL